jgi:cytochrome c-type biogenesis protein
MITSLIVPAFLAGVLTFLAPCTFPLLPAYITFIGGTSVDELRNAGATGVRKNIFINGVLYVCGFSFVFVLLGSLFGLGGGALAPYRDFVSMVGGALIIFFGLHIARIVELPILNYQRNAGHSLMLRPGHPLSAFLFGGTFALGWTPCVGPLLGVVLTLAASSQTVWKGSFLLLIFSAGLAVPFLIIAAGGSAMLTRIKGLNKYLGIISFVGGVLLVILGALLVSNQYQNMVNSVVRFGPFNALLKYY